MDMTHPDTKQEAPPEKEASPEETDTQQGTPPEKEASPERIRAQKEPFSRAEFHNVITSYGSWVVSILGLIFSIVALYMNWETSHREIVQILNVTDDGCYHYDGEKLFKNFRITVANNSTIPVSLVGIEIERNGESRTLDTSDLSGIIPFNVDSNSTQVLTVPWTIPLFSEDNQFFQSEFQKTRQTLDEKDENTPVLNILISSRGTNLIEGHIRTYATYYVPLSIQIDTSKGKSFSGSYEDRIPLATARNEGHAVAEIAQGFYSPIFYQEEHDISLENAGINSASDPSIPLYHSNLSVLYFSMEMYENACHEARTAVLLDYNNALYHYNLSVALHALGKIEESFNSAHIAVDREPGNTVYQSWEKELQTIIQSNN